MHSPASSPPNIQEKVKNSDEIQLTLVRSWLRSKSLYGRILRVLIRRLKYPQANYTSPELEVLLLLSLAELEP